MVEKIAKQQYHIDIKEDEPFFFNIKENGEGKILLQNGCKSKHAHIMITSKRLMMNSEKSGVMHLNGTYKLIKNHFPVVLIGVSDIQGTFHPIAFCITSAEDTHSFTELYTGLLGMLNVNYKKL